MKKTTARPAAAAAGAPAAPPRTPPPAPRGVMTAAEVLEELSDIAAARPDAEDGLPVKMADKLKALEMLRKYHEQTAGGAAADETLTIRLEVLDGAHP